MNKRTVANYVLVAWMCAGVSPAFAASTAQSSDSTATDTTATASTSDAAYVEPVPSAPMLSAANSAAIRSPISNAAPTTPNSSLLPANQALQQSVLDTDLQTQSAENYPSATPLSINRIHFDFQITVGALYDDNIYLAHSNREGDFTLSISPLIIATLGDYQNHTDNYFSVAYQPTFVYYPNHSGLNDWENQVLVDGQYIMNRLTIGGQFRFDSRSGQSTTDINNESVGRVDRNIYDALLRAEYTLTGKISVETELEWLYYDYKNRIDSTDYIGRLFLNYQIAPKIKVGPGFIMGYTDVQDSPSQAYEQALVQVIYAASDKISLDARGGVEFRHYNGGGGDKTNPVFSIGGTYHPYADTTIDLHAYRRQRASADEYGQNYTATGVALTLTQKVFQRFTFGLEGGYEHADYNSVQPDIVANRTDNFYYGRVSFAYDFREWLTAELYYLYRNNDSNDTPRSFYENIGGVQMIFKF